MFVHTHVRFCGVGQGLYTHGRTRLINPPGTTDLSIEWVYDCGSMNESTINASVREHASEQRRDLEFVVISHLDIDHIRGLPALLKAYRVKRIVLPYHQRTIRLCWGLSELDGNVPIDQVRTLIGLWRDPVQTIRAMIPSAGAEDGPQIILVPPSREQAPDEYPPDNPNRDNEPYLPLSADEDTELPSGDAHTAVLVPSRPIIYFRHWEFLPYVDPTSHDAYLSFSSDTKDTLDKKLDDILTASQQNNMTGEDLWEKIVAFKEVFYAAISAVKVGNGQRPRASSKQKNEISLIGYFGAINHKRDLAWAAPGSNYRDARGAPDFPFFAQVARGGLLCTGDAFLESAESIKSLETVLGSKRMANIACHQVAHHGSKHNSNALTHQSVNAPVNVFCANPNAKDNHPAKETVRAYARWLPSPNAPKHRTRRPLVNDTDFEMCMVGACSDEAERGMSRALHAGYPLWSYDSRYWRYYD